MDRLHTGSILWLSSLLLGVVACGGRSLNPSDGGGPGADARADRTSSRDAPRTRADARRLRPDGLPGGLCATNAECPGDGFCNLDGHCMVTGAAGGQCAARPQTCPTDCPGVCGCDGKTHCNACAAHVAGVSVATNQPCLAATCMGLNDAYYQAVEKAKTCCPQCDSLQCQTKVVSGLVCPCDTYVNAAPTAATDAIRAEWMARGCPFQIGDIACEACLSPSSAVCDVATATCVDRP